MKQLVFVIGGCRSGKSKHALQAAEKIAARRKIYIATCRPQDDEMKQRVAQHQKQRSPNWVTIEEPLDLPRAVAQNSLKADVILIDCLTLWTSNLLMETHDEAILKDNIEQLVQALAQANFARLSLYQTKWAAGLFRKTAWPDNSETLLDGPINPLQRLQTKLSGWLPESR